MLAFEWAFAFEWAIEQGNATERLHEKVDHGLMRFGHIRYIEQAAVRLEQAVSFSFCKAAIFEFCRYGCKFPDAIAA